MGVRVYRFDEIEIAIEEPDDDRDIEDAIRQALGEWIEENQVTLQIVGMGDETSDLYLLYNGMELASKNTGDYEEDSIYEMKMDLFERFVDNHINDFEMVEENE